MITSIHLYHSSVCVRQTEGGKCVITHTPCNYTQACTHTQARRHADVHVHKHIQTKTQTQTHVDIILTSSTPCTLIHHVPSFVPMCVYEKQRGGEVTYRYTRARVHTYRHVYTQIDTHTSSTRTLLSHDVYSSVPMCV